MTWMLPALIAVIAGTLILVLVYFYLYIQERKRYIGIWAFSWVIYLLRYIAELYLFLWQGASFAAFFTHIFTLASGVLLLWGTYDFLKKPVAIGWVYGAILSAIYFSIGFGSQAPFALSMLATFIFLGAIYTWTGIVFLRSRQIEGTGKQITGWAFILWGLHKGNYPFLRPVAWFAPWGYLLSTILEMLVAIGIVMVYFAMARKEIYERQEWLRVTLNSIGDAVIATGIDNRVVFMNPVAERITGYREEALGRPVGSIFRIINEDTRQPAEIPIDKVIREGRIVGLANHTALITREGIEISIADSAAPIRSDAGEIIGVVMVFRDITGQRQAEKEQQLLAFIVESTADAIFSFDLDGIITSWNKGAEEIYGYTAGEILGLPVTTLVPEERLDEIRQMLAGIKQGEAIMRYDTVRIKKDGQPIHLSITVSPVKDDNGRVIGISAIARDITGRKQAERVLKRYQLLSNYARDIILFVRYRDGQVLEANNAAVQAYGYTLEELLGMKIHDLRDPETRDDVKVQMEQAWQDGILFETRHRRKDGSTFPVEVSSRGEVIGGEQVLLSIIRDISERRQIEDKIKYLSLHDALTGLYNRNYFEDELQRLEGEGMVPVGIIVCDIDGLKLINDTLGHDAGDALIMTAAGIIRECFLEDDMIARIGGDEFTIILPGGDADIVAATARRIRQAVEKYNEDSSGLPLNISVGFAIKNNLDVSLMDIFKEADNNMYREKLYHSRSRRSGVVQTLIKMLEARDFITEGHARRMREILVRVARLIGVPEQRITDLSLLAEFHDIGKVGIPDRILFKQGQLTPEERAEMQRHCEIGHRIALSSPELAHIADWILKHHEWWNGQGYPLGLKEEEIPLECRILAIADAYDAMTSDRPYRRAMSRQAAAAELGRCAGVQFDPHLVGKFLHIIGNDYLNLA